jgi:hypothetical protein
MESLTPEQIYALPSNTPKRTRPTKIVSIILWLGAVILFFRGNFWSIFMISLAIIFTWYDNKKKLELQTSVNLHPSQDINLVLNPIKDAPLQIEEDEGVYLYCPNAELYRLKSTGRTYGGFSARIIKGIWVHTGESSQKPKKAMLEDKGKLFLTNKRLVFTGIEKNIEISLQKINTYEDTIDNYLLVAFSGSTNATIFKPAGQKAFVWSTGIKRMIELREENKRKEGEKLPKREQRDIVKEIEGLASLRDKGIITSEEFETKKKDLLSSRAL